MNPSSHVREPPQQKIVGGFKAAQWDSNSRATLIFAIECFSNSIIIGLLEKTSKGWRRCGWICIQMYPSIEMPSYQRQFQKSVIAEGSHKSVSRGNNHRIIEDGIVMVLAPSQSLASVQNKTGIITKMFRKTPRRRTVNSRRWNKKCSLNDFLGILYSGMRISMARKFTGSFTIDIGNIRLLRLYFLSRWMCDILAIFNSLVHY